MNLRLVSRMLGIIAWLIGLMMGFSLPLAWPAIGGNTEFESRGFWALVLSICVCLAVGLVFRRLGKDAPDILYRKEAMAIVGLSWVLATVLGALPFYLGDVVYREVNDVEQSMGIADSLFESQSGFSTTGATVLTDIENKNWVPRCILCWRSSTHFLGGLGIIVLFVAVLGQGSAGKALMRAEMPGPSKEGSQERMQHTAWVFAAIYCGLTGILAVILYLEGMTVFQAVCHSFGTMATGGFSTLNGSLGGFENKLPEGYSYRLIEYTVIVFMILAGTNFTLMYLTLIGKPKLLLKDPEWRTYIGIILVATLVICCVGIWGTNEFDPDGNDLTGEELETAFRDGLFQVVSILTTTGFGTADFDAWNNFSRGLLVALMFIGGCAGSTGGGMKVIRHILCVKILGREIEHSFHPSVVRPLRLAGEAITDSSLAQNILIYFVLIAFIFSISSLALLGLESNQTWIDAVGEENVDNRLVDSASAVAATLNNIGPGLGIVGATKNYAPFSATSKLLFTFLMMLGRLELFVILVLFLPGFWRTR